MGKKFDWKATLATVAPAVATALGGPLAGVAIQQVSNALLGKPDGEEAEIAQALATGGTDALVKLKEVENNFVTEMERLGIERDKLGYEDTKSAREREIKTGDSITLQILSTIIIGSFLAIVYKVLFDQITVDSVIAGTLIGYVSAKADTVVGYYFGSSKGSKDKTVALERAFSRGKGMG